MNNKPKILGIIPARSGSKGVPGKNIRLLAGKPLIHYTIQSALLSQNLTTIIISSDDQEIINVSRKYVKVEAPFLRPAELSMDTTPTIEVILHALKYYKEIGKTFDYVCLLQPTSPFRKDNLIDKAINKILRTDGDSLTTIRKVPNRYNPHWTFEMEDDLLSVSTGAKSIIPRRQELPDAWYRDGKIYISRVELVQKGYLLGGKMVGFINEDEPDVNIDTWEDWKLAEQLLSHGYQ